MQITIGDSIVTQEMPYGDRRAMVTDPLGNDWQIATYHGSRAERLASI